MTSSKAPFLFWLPGKLCIPLGVTLAYVCCNWHCWLTFWCRTCTNKAQVWPLTQFFCVGLFTTDGGLKTCRSTHENVLVLVATQNAKSRFLKCDLRFSNSSSLEETEKKHGKKEIYLNGE